MAQSTDKLGESGREAEAGARTVAALFDDIYGFVLSLTHTPAFTGELTIRYEAGTPLHEPLTCRVRLSERVGRKLHMTGELTTASGQVCVRSRSTFIAIDTSRIPGWGDGV